MHRAGFVALLAVSLAGALATPLGAVPSARPSLRVQPATVTAGKPVVLLGAGFAAASRVELFIFPFGSDATKPFASVRTTAQGTFRRQIPIFANSTPGLYAVLACQQTCRVKAGVRLRIVARRTAAAAPRPTATAGAPPQRLDKNLGWSMSHPRIHNLFWDSDWDAHNSGLPKAKINAFSLALAKLGYLNGASQYGVGSASFVDSHNASFICGKTRASATLSSAAVFAWVTCEVLTPGTSVPYPGSRFPISNDLYVVYLPERTLVSDNVQIPKVTLFGHTFGPYVIANEHSCFDYDGYHTLSFGATALFAYAVLATHCVVGDTSPFDALTQDASHEIVEAATDPVLTLGWIDNSYGLGAPGFDRLMKGEAGDICSDNGAVPSPPVTKSSPGVAKGGVVIKSPAYSFVPYWSNRDNACVAG